MSLSPRFSRPSASSPDPRSAQFAQLWWRWSVNSIAMVFAVIWYCIGLIAPLTPSEGYPRLVDWLVFVAVPVGLLIWVQSRIRHLVLKVAILLLAAAMVLFIGLFWLEIYLAQTSRTA